MLTSSGDGESGGDVQRIGEAPARAVHPALFLVLYLPFGATTGFLATPVEFAFSAAHVSAQAIGGVISLALLPQVLKVLWAPLVDTTLSAKTWYLIGVGGIAPGMVAISLLTPGVTALPLLTLLAAGASLMATFAGMAAESLMAHATLPERRGAAGGWSQAGNVGGAGLGGGAGLWISHQFHSLPLAGCVLGALSLICAFALLLAPASTRHPRQPSYFATLREVGRDCWRVCWSRGGLLTLLLFALPLGSGGAATLFATVAAGWGVTPNLLATVASFGGFFIIPVALAGGFVSDRIDRRVAYLLFGLVEGLIALGMALAPHTPAFFIPFAFAYTASIGLAYAGFASVTLETIGRGAAATKYNLLAGVSNIPVALMPAIDGAAASRWGADGMLYLELATAVGGALLFAAVSLATRPRPALAPA
jgi:MFS family permease